MTEFDELARDASERIHRAYWKACDDAGRALDPAELTSETWVIDMLAESYDVAIRRQDHELGWHDSADFF